MSVKNVVGNTLYLLKRSRWVKQQSNSYVISYALEGSEDVVRMERAKGQKYFNLLLTNPSDGKKITKTIKGKGFKTAQKDAVPLIIESFNEGFDPEFTDGE